MIADLFFDASGRRRAAFGASAMRETGTATALPALT
jgi:hypothetical protein